MYYEDVDVAISVLRAELSSWLDRVQAGEEVIVTDRGVPVARLTPIDSTPRLVQLMLDGIVSKPESASRPRAESIDRVSATESVSALIAEQRRPREA